MSNITIISKTVASQVATQIDTRIINMPLYPVMIPEVKVFYGYLKSNSKRIENEVAEGNVTLGDLISGTSKTALLSALTNLVGSITSAVLNFNQLNDNRLNQLQIETETGSWFIDNLRVEHYVTPEPTVALG